MAKKSSKGREVADYKPTESEANRMAAVRGKMRERRSGPLLKIAFDEEAPDCRVTVDHEDKLTGEMLLMHEVGTGDPRFYAGLLSQMAALGAPGQVVSEGASNFAMSVIRAVDPKDEVEAMLAAQMAAVHQATMMMARRLNHIENIPQQDSAERAFNKLARTFTAQMDTLKRYRSTGRQVVRVERVNVNEGGQAIVGSVETGGRGGGKK